MYLINNTKLGIIVQAILVQAIISNKLSIINNKLSIISNELIINSNKLIILSNKLSLCKLFLCSAILVRQTFFII